MSPESFSASWLALREAADHRSRASELLDPLRTWWSARGASTVLDLGAGAGSNVRYLAPRLPGAQEWTLVDHDAALLARVAPTVADARIRTVIADMSAGAGAEAAFDPAAAVADADLVTASALLDLVSDAWLASWFDACADAGAAALFVLSYDGTVSWSGKADPMDDQVLAAVNRHQVTDKGFGPALGPEAGRRAEEAFRAKGFRTWRAPSPWVLTAADGALVRPLVEGWAGAAAESAPDEEDAFRSWAERRIEDVLTGRSSVTVGHDDVLALPPESGAV